MLMKISEYLTKKNLVWLAGTLLVGALGSGLWEAILKPSMLWFGTLMLDIATLGLSSLRDGMYLDVAKGTYERAGVMLLAMATGALCGLITVPIRIGRFLRKRDEDGNTKAARELMLRNNWVFATFALAFIMVFFVSFFRINYIVRASNYAGQLQRITAPYVSESDRMMLDSELAQVKTRDDYVRLIDKLRKVASRNNVSIPEFDIY